MGNFYCVYRFWPVCTLRFRFDCGSCLCKHQGFGLSAKKEKASQPKRWQAQKVGLKSLYEQSGTIIHQTFMIMKNFIPAPIDNKNLMEDAFTDDVEIFGDFYAAPDNYKRGVRHMIGLMAPKDEDGFALEDGIVDASWEFGSYGVDIKVIAVSPCEDFGMVAGQIIEYYKQKFKSWECEDNPGLVVEFKEEEENTLEVSFFYDLDKC